MPAGILILLQPVSASVSADITQHDAAAQHQPHARTQGESNPVKASQQHKAAPAQAALFLLTRAAAAKQQHA